MNERVEASCDIWLWRSAEAPAAWHFVTIDGDAAEAIHATALMRRLEHGRKRGWGSIKVRATIGETSWDTSIFPQKDQRGWLLPLKAAIRKAENLAAGDQVKVTLVY